MDYSRLEKALKAAEDKAKELGAAVSIAIVDQYGDLVVFKRMEGAIKISPRFAIAKAYTSGTLGMPTSDIAKYSGEGQPYYGVTSMLAGDLTVISGGLPIKDGDQLVGGIGVGGSQDVNQDLECAKAGVEALS